MNPRFIQPNALISSTPPPRKYVRALRLAAWNASFVIAGLFLIVVVGEVYLRLTNPFLETRIPRRFVDGVGLIREPNAELRYANWRDDNFVVSRANSQGFLDREPVSAERADEGCRIVFIGDSFVEAYHVPIADKFHARLEEMAARELPDLDIATQAYGIGGTGQINQLPYYDEYARRLNPKLVALVFYINDFSNNSTALQALNYGVDPDRMPFMSAQRDESGALKLRPPDPEYWRFMRPMPPMAWHKGYWTRLVGNSYFAKWLDIKKGWAVDRIEAIRARISAPGLGAPDTVNRFAEERAERLSPDLEEALEYTAFGIEQFKRRTDRDGATLAILASTSYMGTRGDPQFDRLSAIAEARGIPIISDYDYILRQGHADGDGILDSGGHWNATGHQWAAEAVLEWLKANQDVCE